MVPSTRHGGKRRLSSRLFPFEEQGMAHVDRILIVGGGMISHAPLALLYRYVTCNFSRLRITVCLSLFSCCVAVGFSEVA